MSIVPAGDKSCVDAQLGMVQNLGFAAWSQFRARSVSSLQALEIVVRHLASAPGTRILAMLSPGFVTGIWISPKNAIVEAALRGAHRHQRLGSRRTRNASQEWIARSDPLRIHGCRRAIRLAELSSGVPTAFKAN